MIFPAAIEVAVEQGDIDDGITHSCTQCPAALALHRQFPDYIIEVYPPRDQDALFVGLSVYREPDGCSRLSEWVNEYDIGLDMEPATFELERVR